MGYFREYYNRLHRVGDLGSCWSGIQRTATVGAGLDLAKYDKNKDGKVTDEEMLTLENTPVFDFYETHPSDRSIHIQTANEIKAQWKATDQALRLEPVKRAHKLTFDMNLEDDSQTTPPKDDDSRRGND